MVKYKVTVTTAERLHSGTKNHVFIKLVGTEGESERKQLCSLTRHKPFTRGAVSSFTVSCPVSLGKLLLIEVDKTPRFLFPDDSWFPCKVHVTSPEGDAYHFPIYRWISDSRDHLFREGTALQVFEDTHHLGRYSREQELRWRKEQYCWAVPVEGAPHCLRVDSLHSLPCEVRFSFTKKTEFDWTAIAALTELKLKRLADSTDNWTDISAMQRIFYNKTTQLADYVRAHWKDDDFFGYQFLNGVNPMLIRRCSALPENFPVTDDMVFLHGSGSLAEELQKGNMFLCDYKRLDGVTTQIINGKKQYLMAPLVLLHRTPDNKLKPVAIQLKQKPADDNPIFVPTDSEYDWLMAKIFVRSADFSEHQLNAHLLRTHLLAEAFAVSLLRNLPMVHPLYKLLIPHTRYTIHINHLARLQLISETGVFTEFSASGGDGMVQILQRALSSLTYASLCLPDDIAERGLDSVPNFYYRDDGLRLWDIIHRFVRGVLAYFYRRDADVQRDSELQAWIQEIFIHGFLSQASTGIPQSFSSVAELAKFVTMVIFTGSAQHAAVNSGQFDYGGWMPNSPTSLQRPPPTVKGSADECSMLQTLPATNTTVNGMATLWLLSRQSSDFVPLAHYPEEHFAEEIPRKLMRDFQGELEDLSAAIKSRNRRLDVPYTYLDPALVENSVSI
ncbi:arachidonate 15-lipoxygenase B-like [Myripristis murdjan]|uniref:arachidonate 15-lipoxygenase B-like n=1 Tax=Myripristis murdjan TaxID=586833 RepID=UPI001175ED5C|nr:arachidonate 15-lipoxygenase B-like [Myripristis murdjan]